MMCRITDFKKKLILLLCFGAVVFVAREFGVTCLLRCFTGVPCPGCGMTRACVAALRLDFVTAYSFHRMFWSVPILLAYFFCDGRLFRNVRIDHLVLVLLAVGFLVNWVLTLFF